MKFSNSNGNEGIKMRFDDANSFIWSASLRCGNAKTHFIGAFGC